MRRRCRAAGGRQALRRALFLHSSANLWDSGHRTEDLRFPTDRAHSYTQRQSHTQRSSHAGIDQVLCAGQGVWLHSPRRCERRCLLSSHRTCQRRQATDDHFTFFPARSPCPACARLSLLNHSAPALADGATYVYRLHFFSRARKLWTLYSPSVPFVFLCVLSFSLQMKSCPDADASTRKIEWSTSTNLSTASAKLPASSSWAEAARPVGRPLVGRPRRSATIREVRFSPRHFPPSKLLLAVFLPVLPFSSPFPPVFSILFHALLLDDGPRHTPHASIPTLSRFPRYRATTFRSCVQPAIFSDAAGWSDGSGSSCGAHPFHCLPHSALVYVLPPSFPGALARSLTF